MAFILTLCDYELIANTKKVRFRESSGLYHATDNVGGWGAPNIVRADYALLMVADYISTTGRQVLTWDVYNPVLTSDAEATGGRVLNLPQDGWVEVKGYLVPHLAIPVVADMADGALIYDTTLSKLMQKLGGTLVEKEIRDVAANAPYSVTLNTFPVLYNAQRLTELFRDEQLMDFRIDEPGQPCAERDLLIKKAVLLEFRLNGTMIEWQNNNRYVAQQNIEELNSRLSHV